MHSNRIIIISSTTNFIDTICCTFNNRILVTDAQLQCLSFLIQENEAVDVQAVHFSDNKMVKRCFKMITIQAASSKREISATC